MSARYMTIRDKIQTKEKKQKKMRNINLNRLLLTIKWDLVSNWKVTLRMTLSIMFGILCFFAIDILSTRGDTYSPEYSTDKAQALAASLSFIAVLFMSVCASMIFTTMKTKQQRISLLMQPASNMEKFIVKILYSSVGAFIVFIAALFAADLLRALLDFILNQRYIGMVSFWFLKNIFFFCDGIVFFNAGISRQINDMATWLLVIEIIVTGYMTFILGGTLFRQHSWLCTMGMVFIIVYTAGYILIELDFTSYAHRIFFQNNPISPTTLFILTDMALAALIVFELWASYKLFCRMQVINNKWTNL